MRIKLLCSLFCVAEISVALSLAVVAKQPSLVPYADNFFSWWAEVPDLPGRNSVVKAPIELIGAGGIKVNALHEEHRFVNGKYQVYIDGSGIVAPVPTAIKVDSDFAASENRVYFVSHSATCTLPSAVGLAGKEILVWNASSSASVRYATTLNQTISGSAPETISNSSPYKLDRFMSDGSNWYRD